MNFTLYRNNNETRRVKHENICVFLISFTLILMCLLLTVNASSLDEPTHFTLEDISVEEEDTSKNAQTFKKYYLDGLRKNGTPID